MSTTQEQIALLNAEKQNNINAINNLDTSISGLEQAVIDSYTGIGYLNTEISQYENDRADLETANEIIDDIIAILEI